MVSNGSSILMSAVCLLLAKSLNNPAKPSGKTNKERIKTKPYRPKLTSWIPLKNSESPIKTTAVISPPHTFAPPIITMMRTVKEKFSVNDWGLINVIKCAKGAE